MMDHPTHEFGMPTRAPSREGPEVMQAFVARHLAPLTLVAVLVAQLLLLSLQITRNHNVRLIQLWAVGVFEPFERSLHWAVNRVSNAWKTYGGLWQAQRQNQELRTELEQARSRIQLLSEKAAQADGLRALLDFKSGLTFQTVAAEVIAASPGERSNAIFIDKGADAGVAADMAVIAPTGIVGKVSAVFPHTAQVLLISDPSSGTGCMLESSRVQGVLKGTGRNSTQLLYVMNDRPVTVGENVLTSGMDQIYPKGLLAGTVVQTSDGNIYKRIVVKPAETLDRLEMVMVVLKTPSVEQQASNLHPHP